MKALRVRRLLLFPRFHATVKDSLEAAPPEVSRKTCSTAGSTAGSQQAVQQAVQQVHLGEHSADLWCGGLHMHSQLI